MIFLVVRGYLRDHATNSWPCVKGKILDSKIMKIKDTSGADGATIYRAKVHYSYSIDGKEYFSYNLKRGKIGSSSYNPQFDSSKRSSAENKIARYPINSMVDVFYNPSNYNEAILVRGFKLREYFSILLVAIPFTLFGLIFLIMSL